MVKTGDVSPREPGPADMSLLEALRECGWREDGPDRWHLPTDSGCARLQHLAARAGWHHCELEGGGIPAATAGRHLRANASLQGPVKYVADRIDRVTCRCDLPATWNSPDTELELPGLSNTTAKNWQWVQAITQMATGSPNGVGGEIDLAQLGGQLIESGRSASFADDKVLIHVKQPGAFGQIAVSGDPRSGYRLSADLRTLEVGGGAANRAAVQLASEANRRLPLVRFAIRKERPPVLLCEFSFGTVLIPSAWLSTALETVETALALTLRELQALRDPALARLLSAVSTA